MKRHIRMGPITYAKMIKLMLEGEYTCPQLAEMTGLGIKSIYWYTRELHREGAAHICRWGEDTKGRRFVKVYKIGWGIDIPRPIASDKERSRLYRLRKKARLAARLAT